MRYAGRAVLHLGVLLGLLSLGGLSYAGDGDPPPAPPPHAPPPSGPPPPHKPPPHKPPPPRPPLRRPPQPVVTPRIEQAYPEIIGVAVGPQNHAHYPVRVRALERVAWAFDEGRHVGMALPLTDKLLAISAGGGGIRGVDAATGKRAWYSPGETRFWNYSTAIAGPDGMTYGGNYDWIQAVDRNGKRLWRADLRTRWIHRPPALSPDGKTLYVAGDGVGLASIDAATGLVNWLRRDFASPWNTYVFDRKGQLIATTRAGTACYAANGKELWRLRDPMSHLCVVGDLLIGTRRGGLGAIDLRTRESVWLWRHRGTVCGIALGDDGRIRVALADGTLASVDLAGQPRWLRRISKQPLRAPVTTQGGETVVADAAGTLFLVGSGGSIQSSLATNGAPYRWRPSVGRDGRVYLGHAQRLVCVDGTARPPAKALTASELAIVADDFVVDIWHNGKRVPLSARRVVSETHGATSERVSLDLRAGDWVVFNVVANRLRWNGASYFGVRAAGPEGEMAFVSSTKSGWYACDDPGRAPAFIAQRDAGLGQAVVAPANPWHDAPRIWKSLLDQPFPGTPVWGKAPLTWIKYVVGPPGGKPPVAKARQIPPEQVDLVGSSKQFWLRELESLRPGMTPEQARRAVPSLDPFAALAGMTGGGQVYVQQLSARWLARLTFLHERGLVGAPELIDAADEGTRVCLLIERAYIKGWKTVGELLVADSGAYAWTRYDHTDTEHPTVHTVKGQVPGPLLAQVRKTFGPYNQRYLLGVDDTRSKHPESITALLEHLYGRHTDRDS